MEKLTTLYEANVEAMDTLNESTAPQKNQAVLDELGENANGLLTYKGKQVGVAASLPPIEAVVDLTTTSVHTTFTNCLTIETPLPENARVKKVEIPDVVNETDEYIQLEDMVAKDPVGLYAPYFIMYPKNMSGVYSSVAAAVVFMEGGTNNFYEKASGFVFENKTIKIYYEIEE